MVRNLRKQNKEEHTISYYFHANVNIGFFELELEISEDFHEGW